MNKQILIDIIDLVRKAVEDGTTVFPMCDYLAETFDLYISADSINTNYHVMHGSDNVVRKFLSVIIKTDKNETVCVDARHEDVVFNVTSTCYSMYLKINIRNMLFLDQTITFSNEKTDCRLKDSTLVAFRDFITCNQYCLSFIDYTTPFDVLHAAVAAEYDAVRLSDGLYCLSSFRLSRRIGELLWELAYKPPILKKSQILELRFSDYKME